MWQIIKKIEGGALLVTNYCNGTLRSTKFSKFDDFLKNSFKGDVALKHEFTRYQYRKIIERVHKQSPRGGKKEAECRKVRETSKTEEP